MSCNFESQAGTVPESWGLAKGWINSLVSLIKTNMVGLDKVKAVPDGTLVANFSAQWSPCEPPMGALVMVLSVPVASYVYDGSNWVSTTPNEVVPVGARMVYSGTLPDGWLFCDSKTIGDASSNSTARANADTETLFVYLWDTYANTELPIYTSAGAGSTRGASGLADFVAHKRLALPDVRGRVIAGLDNLGGSSANRLTASAADTPGGSGGAETHTLITGETPQHTHTLSAAGSNGSNNPTVGTSMLIDGAVPQIYSTNAGGVGTVLTNTTGGGGAHNNVQPYIAEGWIIRYR